MIPSPRPTNQTLQIPQSCWKPEMEAISQKALVENRTAQAREGPHSTPPKSNSPGTLFNYRPALLETVRAFSQFEDCRGLWLAAHGWLEWRGLAPISHPLRLFASQAWSLILGLIIYITGYLAHPRYFSKSYLQPIPPQAASSLVSVLMLIITNDTGNIFLQLCLQLEIYEHPPQEWLPAPYFHMLHSFEWNTDIP